MNIPAEIKMAMDKASRIIVLALRQQAPVAKEGRDRGDLRNSIKVTPIFTSTENFGFEITANEYGLFLDGGTGRYKTKDRKEWNPNPGKGDDGIKPRFWLSVPPRVWKKVNALLSSAIKKYLQRKFK